MGSTSFAGTGPGARTADGCSVSLYARTPYRGELEPLRARLEAGAGRPLLELGCGTGRHTRVLLDWGWAVTAVDDSAEMLAHVPAAARAVRSGIETLRLDERFDVVLLASGLVNHPDAAMRGAFAQTLAHHLAPGGRCFVERQDPAWLRNAKPGPLGVSGGVAFNVNAVQREADGRVFMELDYTFEGERWTHSFTVAVLEDDDVIEWLEAVGLHVEGFVDPARRWLAARAAG